MDAEYNCCRYCKYSVYVPVERNVLCHKEGLVQSANTCKKFVFDPFKLRVKRLRTVDFSKYENEDYSIE